MLSIDFLFIFFTVEERKRPLKRFTPPRKSAGSDSDEESDSDYSDSEYSDSYT